MEILDKNNIRVCFSYSRCVGISESKRQIVEYNEAISKYKVMTFIDGVTLLIDGFSQLDQRT